MMPKPLPRRLVERLRRLAKKEQERKGNLDRGYRLLAKMENADHRAPAAYEGREGRERVWWFGDERFTTGNITEMPTFRIRKLNAKRSFPETELVIKRIHGGTGSISDNDKKKAEKIIEIIRDRIKKFGRPEKGRPFVLRELPAEAIAGDLIAMPKVDFPSVEETLEEWMPTERGRKHLEKMMRRHKFTLEGYLTAANAASSASRFGFGNLLFVGVEKGKFVFMPLADLW